MLAMPVNLINKLEIDNQIGFVNDYPSRKGRYAGAKGVVPANGLPRRIRAPGFGPDVVRWPARRTIAGVDGHDQAVRLGGKALHTAYARTPASVKLSGERCIT